MENVHINILEYSQDNKENKHLYFREFLSISIAKF